MEKYIYSKSIKMILCLIGFCILLTGCGKQKLEEDTTLKIGVAIYRGDDAFINSLVNYLEEEAKEKEELLGKKIIINLADAKSNQSSQNDQVDEFISKSYDVICVNMVDRTVASVIIDKAKEADIPVIFFNREPVGEDMQIWDKIYYVGTDAREAGQMEGQLIADYYEKNRQIDKNGDGKLQYVMLEGEQSHQDSLIRTEHSVKNIVDRGIEVEKLAGGNGIWLRSPAFELMKSWLTKYGDQIEVVISNNDEMALGAIEAIEDEGYGDNAPAVFGIDGTRDGLEMIEKGKMQGTIENNAREQADVILDIAVACSTGQDVEKEVIMENRYVRIPHRPITAENLHELMK